MDDQVRRRALEILQNPDAERSIYATCKGDVNHYIYLVQSKCLNWSSTNAPHGTLCKRCKSHSVQIRMQQTRSSDEGMTAIHECTACGLSWHG